MDSYFIISSYMDNYLVRFRTIGYRCGVLEYLGSGLQVYHMPHLPLFLEVKIPTS